MDGEKMELFCCPAHHRQARPLAGGVGESCVGVCRGEGDKVAQRGVCVRASGRGEKKMKKGGPSLSIHPARSRARARARPPAQPSPRPNPQRMCVSGATQKAWPGLSKAQPSPRWGSEDRRVILCWVFVIHSAGGEKGGGGGGGGRGRAGGRAEMDGWKQKAGGQKKGWGGGQSRPRTHARTPTAPAAHPSSALPSIKRARVRRAAPPCGRALDSDIQGRIQPHQLSSPGERAKALRAGTANVF